MQQDETKKKKKQSQNTAWTSSLDLDQIPASKICV